MRGSSFAVIRVAWRKSEMRVMLVLVVNRWMDSRMASLSTYVRLAIDRHSMVLKGLIGFTTAVVELGIYLWGTIYKFFFFVYEM